MPVWYVDGSPNIFRFEGAGLNGIESCPKQLLTGQAQMATGSAGHVYLDECCIESLTRHHAGILGMVACPMDRMLLLMQQARIDQFDTV